MATLLLPPGRETLLLPPGRALVPMREVCDATLLVVLSPIRSPEGHLHTMREPLATGQSVAAALPRNGRFARVIWNGAVLTPEQQAQVLLGEGMRSPSSPSGASPSPRRSSLPLPSGLPSAWPQPPSPIYCFRRPSRISSRRIRIRSALVGFGRLLVLAMSCPCSTDAIALAGNCCMRLSRRP